MLFQKGLMQSKQSSRASLSTFNFTQRHLLLIPAKLIPVRFNGRVRSQPSVSTCFQNFNLSNSIILAQVEAPNGDSNIRLDHCTDSNQAQRRVPVDQPIENPSITERILGNNTEGAIQDGLACENSDQQSQQLSLPGSRQTLKASGSHASCQPSSADNQSHNNAEHHDDDDIQMLERNGDLPTSIQRKIRPADVLNNIQPPQSRQQDLAPESDPAGSSSQPKPPGPEGEIRYEMQDGTLRLLPTENQYQNFPRLIQLARELGAHQTGAFKILVPNSSVRYALSPPYRDFKAMQNWFSIQSRDNGTFQVTRSSRRARLPSTCGDNADATTDDSVRRFESLLQTPDWFQDVEYCVDLDARSREERRRLGLPLDSPIFPLEGNRLSKTRTNIPGIHTPYAYWSGSKFGAPFAMHVEDCWLSSVNYLYTGEKIWFIVEPQSLKTLEDKLRIESRKASCSQFLRHDASYSPKSCLEEWGVSYRVLSQKPGEIVYTFGRAYHQGFSTGPTIAEAVNFAEKDWTVEGYQFCKRNCPPGSILGGMMDLCSEGELQNDGSGEDDDYDAIAKKNKRLTNNGSGKGKAPSTGKKRKLDKEASSERERKRRTTDLVRHAEVQEAALPPDFLKPAEIAIRLRQTQIETKNVPTLIWYFFNIGSPQALLKLREAFIASRTRKSSPPQGLADTTGHIVRSLDTLDDQQFSIAILRRYYLVRLVQHHDEMAAAYQTQKRTRNHAQGPSERYLTSVLHDLMNQAYPTLLSKSEYEKRWKSLQNRISSGRNWHKLVKEFGYGILALVPISKESPNSS